MDIAITMNFPNGLEKGYGLLQRVSEHIKSDGDLQILCDGPRLNGYILMQQDSK